MQSKKETLSAPVAEAQKEQSFKKCPFCAEEIQIDAIKCKHCATDLAIQDATKDKVNYLICKQCGGEMMKKRVAASTPSACLSLLLGILALFWIWPIGLGLIIIGLVLGSAVKKYWICKKCKCKVEKG